MIKYILVRCCLVFFIAMTLLWGWSLFGPTEYHYTTYYDVHIISEQTSQVHCNGHDHTLYTVKYIGTNKDGEQREFTAKFYGKGDTDDGATYDDIKNGTVTIHNCAKSWWTWIGFLFGILCGMEFLCEEDYNIHEVNKFRFKYWKYEASFLGYDCNVINKVLNYFNKYYLGRIISYKELYSKYKEFKVKPDE